jgi:hypothetical protein
MSSRLCHQDYAIWMLLLELFFVSKWQNNSLTIFSSFPIGWALGNSKKFDALAVFRRKNQKSLDEKIESLSWSWLIEKIDTFVTFSLWTHPVSWYLIVPSLGNWNFIRFPRLFIRMREICQLGYHSTLLDLKRYQRYYLKSVKNNCKTYNWVSIDRILLNKFYRYDPIDSILLVASYW